MSAQTVTEKWTRDYVPAEPPASVKAVATDSAGDVFILLTDHNSTSGNRVYTAKYSGSDGHVIWEKFLDAAFLAHGLALDPQGNPAILGRASGISGDPSDVFDFYTVKYAGSNGAVLWEKRQNNGFQDYPFDLTTNQAGDVIVTGSSNTLNGSVYSEDIYTVSYAASDGHILWERRVNGVRNDTDQGHVVGVDGAGDVFVTGTITYTSSTGEDVYLGKYSGVDGHVIWQTEKTLLSGYDSGSYLKIDPQGNPVVLAESPGPGGYRNSITTKYNGATGAVIWTQSYDGPAHRNDRPQGLAIDGVGDVFVIMDSEGVDPNGIETGSDYYTVKYAAADGGVLWEKRYDSAAGPPTPEDRPRGLALDPAGNPIVTGQIAVHNARDEIYTVSYRNSDGAVLWEKQEKRYPNGSMLADTDPIALAPGGGVIISVGVPGKLVTIKYVVTGQSAPARFLNIATRMKVETGDNALIAGFIITGSQPKKVLIRGIGPSLPFNGVLADPTLNLDNGAVTNNDWRTSQEQEINATTIPPSNDLESAIIATLSSGGHTAILRGNGGAHGIGVVEVYDLESGAPVQLANISSRGLVQSGDDVMIGGLIVAGGSPAKVLIRAIGPSLPFSGVLADPTLELVDQNGARTSNDNWRTTQEAEITATTIPPSNDKESAILATLAPGNYTAIVRGQDNTTGIAVVEAYNLQ